MGSMTADSLFLPSAGNTLIVGSDVAMTDDASAPAHSDGGSTATLERPDTETKIRHSTDDGDSDRYAHYVAKDKVLESRLTGRPVVALCGKVWVPKHDASKYPVCPECQRIYEQMRDMGN